MKVELTQEEIQLATQAGNARFSRRRSAGSVHRWKRDQQEHTSALEIESIGAEIAAARAIGKVWEDSADLDPDGDIGPGLQVRHTRLGHGVLIIHTTDNPDHFFFLVTGIMPCFEVRGWIMARDGMKAEWLRKLVPDRCDLYAVPQVALKSAEYFNPPAESDPGLQPTVSTTGLLTTNPVWKAGPKICPDAWLPAFGTAGEMYAYHQRNSPRCKIVRTWQCELCGCWHMQTDAPDPSGDSSGTGRSAKAHS